MCLIYHKVGKDTPLYCILLGFFNEPSFCSLLSVSRLKISCLFADLEPAVARAARAGDAADPVVKPPWLLEPGHDSAMWHGTWGSYGEKAAGPRPPAGLVVGDLPPPDLGKMRLPRADGESPAARLCAALQPRVPGTAVTPAPSFASSFTRCHWRPWSQARARRSPGARLEPALACPPLLFRRGYRLYNTSSVMQFGLRPDPVRFQAAGIHPPGSPPAPFSPATRCLLPGHSAVRSSAARSEPPAGSRPGGGVPGSQLAREALLGPLQPCRRSPGRNCARPPSASGPSAPSPSPYRSQLYRVKK